jgi:predicted phage-related endonuclease
MMFATPDRWILSAADRPGQGILQIKCSSDHDSWRYGPPVYVQCQVQHEMAVTGRQWGAVVVLLDGNRMVHWDLDRNEDFIAELEEECRAFWAQVESGVAPPIDPHPATLDALKRMHPLDNGQTIELGTEVAVWMDALRLAKAEATAAEDRAEALEARIREAMGPFTYATLPGGRMLSLKHQTNPARTQIVPENTFRTLRELKATGQAAKRAPKATAKGDR